MPRASALPRFLEQHTLHPGRQSQGGLQSSASEARHFLQQPQRLGGHSKAFLATANGKGPLGMPSVKSDVLFPQACLLSL